MSEFYHKPSTSAAGDFGTHYSIAMQAFLDDVNEMGADLLYAQLRVHNRVVDDYMTHPLKTRLNVFTVSEGVVGLAVGIAQREGLLDLDEKLCDCFPEQVNERTSPFLLAVTVRHLLTMTVGLKSSLFMSDDPERYKVKDWMRFYFDSEFVSAPGENFLHCDLNTYLLSRMIEKKAGVPLVEYLRDRLFEPIGIGNPDWLPCPLGHTMGANGLYLTVEEMGLLGQLILFSGQMHGHDIVGEDYLSDLMRIQMMTDSNLGYGYHYWISPYPATLLLKGRFGQGIIISADKDAVLSFQALEGYKYDRIFEAAAKTLQRL